VRVSVVIPTHNEAQSIGRVLADLPADIVTEVLVVDSNSTDGTPRSPQRWEPASSANLAADTVALVDRTGWCSSPDVVVFSTAITAIDQLSCRFS